MQGGTGTDAHVRCNFHRIIYQAQHIYFWYMTVKFEKVFSVYFEHKYFADNYFTGFAISPTEESVSLLKKYSLIFKHEKNSFTILFNTFFDGYSRNKASLLKENIALRFCIELIDPLFYQYTGNMPNNHGKRIFCFSNFDEKQQISKNSDLLHATEYVSESEAKLLTNFEMLPMLNSSHYFGYIDIRFNVHLAEIMYVRFLNRSTHWCYILIGEYFQQFEKMAIIDSTDQKLFTGPEKVELPDGREGIAFTSFEPIALTQQKKLFQLGDNYDQINKHFKTKLISMLPNPDLISISKIDDGNEHNISNIYIHI